MNCNCSSAIRSCLWSLTKSTIYSWEKVTCKWYVFHIENARLFYVHLKLRVLFDASCYSDISVHCLYATWAVLGSSWLKIVDCKKAVWVENGRSRNDGPNFMAIKFCLFFGVPFWIHAVWPGSCWVCYFQHTSWLLSLFITAFRDLLMTNLSDHIYGLLF